AMETGFTVDGAGGWAVEVARGIAVAFAVDSADRLGDAVRVGVGVEVLFTTLACDVTTGSGGKVETGGANAIVGTGLGADVRSACVGVVVAVGIGCEVRTWRG